MMIKKIGVVLVMMISFVGQSQVKNNLEAIVQMGHSKYITASDFSPNGAFIATGSLDNSIILWNLKTGKQIRCFNYHSKSVRALHFSNDGAYLLSGSADNTVKLMDVKSGQLILTIQANKKDFSNAYFSDNNQYIVILDKRGGTSIWSAKTGEKVRAFKKDYAAHKESRLINGEGTKVLSKIDYKSVGCYALPSGKLLFSLPFDKAYTMQFSPNGKFIVIGSTKLFSAVYNAENGELLHELKSNSEAQCDGCNTKVAISPLSKYVFTISNKKDGLLWDSKTGKKIRKISNIDERPDNVIFSPNEKYLLLSFDEKLIVYDVKTGHKKFEIKNKWIEYYEFKWHHSKNWILLPGQFDTAEIWDVVENKKIKSIKGYLNQQRGDGLNLDYTNWVEQTILTYISYKNNLSISQDNNHVTIGKVDSVALVLDLKTGKIKQLIGGNNKAILCHDYSKDGNWLATAGGDGVIKVYATEDYSLKYEINAHDALIFDLKFSGNSEEIVSGSWDANIRVWDFKNEVIKQNIYLDNISPYLVRYSPNDLYVLSGSLKQDIKFWEIDTREDFRSLIGHTKTISGIEFSKDNRFMVTSSWDGKIKQWDVLTGMQLLKIKHEGGPVYAVIYSNNGKEIVSGGADGVIRIYDALTGVLKSELKGHSAAVTALQFTSDSQKLVSRSANGTFKIWNYSDLNEIYTYIQIDRYNWLAKNSAGYFDGSKKALSLVNYVSGVEVVSVASLFEKYYTPNLVSRLMSGEKMNDTGENFQNLLKDRPQLAFNLPESKLRANTITKDSIFVSKIKTISLDVSVVGNGHEIKEIRLYNNNKLVENENLSDIAFRGGRANFSKTFEIELIDGINEIIAIGVDENRVESDPITLKIGFDGVSAQTDLYIFSIGINEYKNESYNLNYAVKDANDFLGAVSKGGKRLFNKVFQYNLLNSEATKIEISAVFKQITEQIGPEDVFVFYYAGHGVMSLKTADAKADFYVVAHNVTNFYGDQNLLRDEGISATELLNYSKIIAAQKQLFILDACHSGGALDAFASRGDGREKTIAQLARNTGTFFLTASQDIQYANEAGDLKHGLFTYALLEILEGMHEGSSIDGKITINEMKTYVEDRVPELSEQYFGSTQYPTSFSFGQDFPIVILK